MIDVIIPLLLMDEMFARCILCIRNRFLSVIEMTMFTVRYEAVDSVRK
jgi:hypothetical protein